jgi:hypothetical protein
MGTIVEVDRLQPMAASDLESNLNGSSELFSLSLTHLLWAVISLEL